MKSEAKYKLIENYILERIKSKELKPGDQIETEQELSEKFQIGRITINKALNNLATQGIITRTAGKGSFVTKRTYNKSFKNRNSFSEDMALLGKKAGSILVEYKVFKAETRPELMEMFNIGPNDYIHFFSRIRTADDKPIALSDTYLNANIVHSLDVKALGGSLKEQLLSMGIAIGGAKYITMSAHLATSEQKKLLNVSTAALLKNSHISYTVEGIAYEFSETYYLGDYYEYYFSTDENTEKLSETPLNHTR